VRSEAGRRVEAEEIVVSCEQASREASARSIGIGSGGTSTRGSLASIKTHQQGEARRRKRRREIGDEAA